MKKDVSETENFLQIIAQMRGWKLNWDQELILFLKEGLTQNFNKFNFYLCPNRDSNGSRMKDQDIICPCIYADADIQEFGHCYCGLFLHPLFWNFHLSTKSIPERRPLNKDIVA